MERKEIAAFTKICMKLGHSLDTVPHIRYNIVCERR